jgi:carboxypeptidase C (cathepsin A)
MNFWNCPFRILTANFVNIKPLNMRKLILRANLFFLLTCLSIFLRAQMPPVVAADTAVPKTDKFITKHSIKIDGKPVNYTATAGTMVLKNEKDEPIAIIGYTAYIKDGETDLTKRPVTFVYNGGPGSSSMWLHLGVIGPRRVVVNDPELNGPPPYKLEDNNFSILDVSDIVLIDPVGTGLSRAAGKSKNVDFWGVDQDIKSVSQFIKLYVTDNERWNSPKYLLGESYGTFRSAGVADYLLQNMGIAVNGVVLVSSVLDIRTLSFLPGDDISYIVNLPSYAATSWFHNKLPNKPADLNAFLKEVRNFASGEYAAALIKGDQLPAAEREQILNKLTAYTGLSKDYLDKANLRVLQPQYSKELLRNEHQAVGRLDARYKGISQDLLGEFAFTDPADNAISPAFISAFMNYYTTELKVSKDKTYNTAAYGLADFRWDWKHAASNGLFGDAATPNTGVDLANAMSTNPRLKILVLNGVFDLATPFYGTEFTFDHLGLEKKLKNNITMKYYEAGHMMYINSKVAAAFKKDVAAFILDGIK